MMCFCLSCCVPQRVLLFYITSRTVLSNPRPGSRDNAGDSALINMPRIVESMMTTDLPDHLRWTFTLFQSAAVH